MGYTFTWYVPSLTRLTVHLTKNWPDGPTGKAYTYDKPSGAEFNRREKGDYVLPIMIAYSLPTGHHQFSKGCLQVPTNCKLPIGT